MSRKLIASACVLGLFGGVLMLIPGCGEEAGQASRGSISAPRNGGGAVDAGAEKGKPKGAEKAKGKADL